MTDALYGQKDLAEFCEYVIAALFEIGQPSSAGAATSGTVIGCSSEGIDTPPYTPAASPSHIKQPPVLLEFIAYALYRTRLPVSIVHQSLLLLSRLKQRYPSARGTSSSPHRLFLSSLMLSAKISMDDTYSNKSWAIVGSSYFSLREVNQMERELFAFLGWNVVASKFELDNFVSSAEAAWSRTCQQRARDASRTRRAAEEEARHEQAKHAARALLRPHTYRHTSPSSSKSSRSLSPPSSAQRYQANASMASSPQQTPLDAFGYPTSSSQAYSSQSSSQTSSTSSSAFSSAFPSAVHSPSSPASAPLSAGPQTPDNADNLDVHHCPRIQGAPDIPEAAAYVSTAIQKRQTWQQAQAIPRSL